MTEVLRIYIPGRPAAFERAGRDGRSGRTFTPKRMATFKRSVAQYAALAFGNRAPMTGPLIVAVVSSYGFPKSWSRKKRQEISARRNLKIDVPDADNLFKCCADAMNKIVYCDDEQVCITLGAKRYAETDKTVILITDAMETNGMDAIIAAFRRELDGGADA